MPAESWPAQQLAAFLATVAAAPDERAAWYVAVERAAEALDAEIGVLVRQGGVLASVGFGRDDTASEVLVDERVVGPVELPGLGVAEICVASFEDPTPSRLVLARMGAEPFGRSEVGLLGAMARVLGLTLGSLRRQMVLEHMAHIQRAIAQRLPLCEVLDSITRSAAELLGDETSAVRLLDAEAGHEVVTESSFGLTDEQLEACRRLPALSGVGGAAIAADDVVVWESYHRHPDAIATFASADLQASMAAPVRAGGEPIGCLVVASYRSGRQYSTTDRETLVAFAEHASVAINDARTVEALHRAVDDATHQALHDGLTGMPNRALFVDRLELALARAQRRSDGVSVLFIDLDDFKLVNDDLGHATGDELLRQVGARLAGCVRAVDTAARLGGDEFAVVVEHPHDDAEGTVVAERILDSLRDPFHLAGEEMFVTGSIGIASAGPGTTASELVRYADVAMYHAKSKGKHRYAVFEPAMYEALVRRRVLETELRSAVAGDGLRVHYQPMVALTDGRIVGVEALVRWAHAERGLLGPLEFIEAAEDIGLVVELGRQVLVGACWQLREWRDTGAVGDGFGMSINLSPRELLDPDYADRVAATLAAHGLPPEVLTLEITETVLMKDGDLAEDRLRALKELGVRLALDDFGTGYSSLAYLRRYPVDVLKIDKAFIGGGARAEADGPLLRAIIELGRALGIETVAEGVEEDHQADWLRALGCRVAQGFLFARPMPAADVEAYVRASAERFSVGAASVPGSEAVAP